MKIAALLRRERGATLVETAIVLPLILLKNAIHTASHEAARYGSSVGINSDGDKRYTDCDGMRTEGIALSGGTDLTPSNFAIAFDDGPSGSPLSGHCNGSDSTATVSEGDRVVVTVTKNWSAVTPLVNRVFGPFTVSSTARRTILSP